MSDELSKVLRRFEERLARLESEIHAGPAHWKLFHLHKALDALEGDHATANQHLDEFDRATLVKEFPELDADKVPTIEEIRARFDTIAGGMV